jgi:hypothetical protein
MAMLVEQRKAGLRQVDLAKKSASINPGSRIWNPAKRRIDVVELIELGRAIGFDPADMVRKLARR